MSAEDELQYFPTNYADSRKRFLSLTSGEGLQGSWHVPSPTEKDLFVDYLLIPAAEMPQRLFVIFSGVHGLEAYAGAGLQFLFLTEFLQRWERRRNGLLLVHALNPYGFKNHSRATENRVNLNRNCSIHPDLYQLKNPRSLEISCQAIPRSPVDSMLAPLLANGIDPATLDEFVKTVGQGQFEDPEALEFGGFQPEPQIAQLIEFLKKTAPAYQDLILFDLHTGLGDRGRLHLLDGDLDGCVHPQLFAELFQPEHDCKIYDHTSNDSEGFYRTHGATNHLFPEVALAHQRCLAMTLEFGTLGHSREAQLEGLNRWLLEHQGALHGYGSPELEAKIKDGYLERFFPRGEDWRRTVLHTGRTFWETIMGRAGALQGL